MKRVQADADWPLFCPNEAPGLHDVWGDEFERLFEKYESEGRAKKTVKAQKLWYAIMEAQVETGGPFMLYKDAANRKLITTICCKDIPDNVPQESPTNRISLPSSLLICALRSSSSHHLRKRRCAILALSHSLLSFAAKNTSSKSFTMLPKLLPSTLIGSLM